MTKVAGKNLRCHHPCEGDHKLRLRRWCRAMPVAAVQNVVRDLRRDLSVSLFDGGTPISLSAEPNSQRSERRGVSTQSWHVWSSCGESAHHLHVTQKGKGPARRGNRKCELLNCSPRRDTATTAPFTFIALHLSARRGGTCSIGRVDSRK